jgi:antitoxin MazE
MQAFFAHFRGLNGRGRIVIERVRPRKYELSELVKGITNKNQHREIDFGPAVGGEIW